MNSMILLILELLICIIFLLILYIKEREMGLFYYCLVAIIVSTVFTPKMIDLYDYEINLGIIPYITIFSSFNIIIQKRGINYTKPLLLSLISYYLLGIATMYLINIMKPSEINLFTNASYNNLFLDNIGIYFAILVSMLYSLLLNNKIYFYLKSIKNNILISNLFSTIMVHALSSTIFIIISNLSKISIINMLRLIMIRYILSITIGVICTIPIYITKYIKEK